MSIRIEKKVNYFYEVNGTENYTVGDSVFATLNFQILENAPSGNAAICMTYDPNNVYNIKENNISFAVHDGEVTVLANSIDVSITEATEYRATALFSNTSNASVTAVYALAAYTVDGKMIGINMKSYALEKGEAYPVTITYDGNDKIATVKGFVLLKDSFAPIQSVWDVALSSD